MNKPGDGLTAPIPASRDDRRLNPSALADHELNASQAIAAFDELVRLAREPRHDPFYPMIHSRLVKLAHECDQSIEEARRSCALSVKLELMTSQLDMGDRDNIAAYAAACDDLAADESAIEKLTTIRAEIRLRLAH